MSRKAKIAIVVTGVASALIAVGTVTFNRGRGRSVTAAEACLENMRQVEAAKYQWAVDASNAAAGISVTTNNSPRMP